MTWEQPDAPTVTWEAITPTVAQELLGRNDHNRPLTKSRVASLASDMVSGRWVMNGEAIKLAKDGTLLDGQHRLAAVVQANVPINMLVVRGLHEKAQETMDTGGKRTFSNQLTLRGETYSYQLAAVLRMVWLWRHQGDSLTSAGFVRPPTNGELFELLEAYPEVRVQAPLVNRLVRNANMPGQVAGLCVWLLYRVDADDANAFFTALESGVGLQANDPIYVLRELLLRRPVAGDRAAVRSLVAITIKAWNKYRRGEPCTALRWVQGGAHPEAFPAPL